MPKITEPRRAYMTAEQLCGDLQSIFGESFQVKFSDLAGVSKSQVNRYANAISPIPKHMAVLIGALKTLRECELPLPKPPSVPKPHAEKQDRRLLRAKRAKRKNPSRH